MIFFEKDILDLKSYCSLTFNPKCHRSSCSLSIQSVMTCCTWIDAINDEIPFVQVFKHQGLMFNITKVYGGCKTPISLKQAVSFGSVFAMCFLLLGKNLHVKLLMIERPI